MEDMLPVADIIRRLHELNPNGIPKWNPCPSRLREPEVARKWRNDNPDKARSQRWYSDVRRRARLKGSIGSFTQIQWANLVELYKHRCYYCQKKTKRLTIDHIIPLSKGGTNYITNVIPACSHCNSSKHDKLWDAQLALNVTPSLPVATAKNKTLNNKDYTKSKVVM